MKRTHLLFIVAISGLVAALLLPRLHRQQPHGVVSPPTVHPPPPQPLAAGSIDLQARPARHAIQASGDDLDVVYDLSAPAGDAKRLPVDFALILDRSGSMTGDPLQKAKAAAISLVDRLEPTDRLAVVDFGSEARIALNATAMNDEGKKTAHQVISRIEADGGTNTSSALQLARNALINAGAREGAIRRIVLLSDGMANEGIIGPGLIELVRQLNGQHLRVSALGLGLEFDEDMMLAMADAGGGQYRYLRNADEVAAALTQELAQAGATAASGLTLTMTPSDGVEIRDVVGYEATHDGGSVRLGLSDLAAGEHRHVVVRVHVGAGGTGNRPLVDARLTYEDVHAGHQQRASEALASVEATTDSSRIASSYDRDAAKMGMRARWGGTMLQAMHAYGANNVAGATTELNTSLDELKGEAAAIGDTAMLDEFKAKKQEAEKVMAAAPAASAQGMMARKSLKSFGVSEAR